MRRIPAPRTPPFGLPQRSLVLAEPLDDGVAEARRIARRQHGVEGLGRTERVALLEGGPRVADAVEHDVQEAAIQGGGPRPTDFRKMNEPRYGVPWPVFRAAISFSFSPLLAS